MTINYRILSSAVMVFLFALVSSCNNDNGNVRPGPSGATDVISAYVNGEYWGLSGGYAEIIPTANLRISCTGSYGSMILSVSPFNGIQTYTIDGFNKIQYAEGGIEYRSIRGQIQITQNTPDYIEGQFNCELVSTTGSTSLVFTEGQFSVPKY